MFSCIRPAKKKPHADDAELYATRCLEDDLHANQYLGLPLDERIVNIGFRDGSRAEANPYKSADLAFLS